MLPGRRAPAEQDAIFAGPGDCGNLLQRLSWRGGLTLLIGPTILVFFPGRYVIEGLVASYGNPVLGGLGAAGSGILALFLATFYFRHLGLLVYRCRGSR